MWCNICRFRNRWINSSLLTPANVNGWYKIANRQHLSRSNFTKAPKQPKCVLLSALYTYWNKHDGSHWIFCWSLRRSVTTHFQTMKKTFLEFWTSVYLKEKSISDHQISNHQISNHQISNRWNADNTEDSTLLATWKHILSHINYVSIYFVSRSFNTANFIHLVVVACFFQRILFTMYHSPA